MPKHNGGTKFSTGMLSAGIEPSGMIQHNQDLDNCSFLLLKEFCLRNLIFKKTEVNAEV